MNEQTTFYRKDEKGNKNVSFFSTKNELQDLIVPALVCCRFVCSVITRPLLQPALEEEGCAVGWVGGLEGLSGFGFG